MIKKRTATLNYNWAVIFKKKRKYFSSKYVSDFKTKNKTRQKSGKNAEERSMWVHFKTEIEELKKFKKNN